MSRHLGPGLSFQEMLRSINVETLERLIGPDVTGVLRAFEPDMLEETRLRELAVRFLDPIQLLSNPITRDIVVRSLPLAKATELADRTGLSGGRALYGNLSRAFADEKLIPKLLSFLGVVVEPRAPRAVAADYTQATSGYALFPHQRRAAERVLAALSQEPRKVVLHMPTGAGKTRTAMHLVATYLRDHEPSVVCWFAQSAELLDQAADEFEKAWHYLGNRSVDLVRFWGSRSPRLEDLRDGVIVGGLAKVSALNTNDPGVLLRLADRVSLTVMDEAHQAIAPTYSEVLVAFYYKNPHSGLLGLTATPGRSWSQVDEDKKLSDFFDGRKVTLEVEGFSDPVTFLIEEGYLAKPQFTTLNSQAGLQLTDSDLAELSRSVDIPEALLERLGTDTQRNLKIVASIEDLLDRHRRVVVFAPSVTNARLLTAILATRNREAFLVTGETSTNERERAINRFKSSDPQPMVIVNFGVLTTGFDAPSTSAAVIARPTKSLVLYSQMVGRATRGIRAGGNKEAEIVTVVDPELPGFGSVATAFTNWEDVWHEH